MIAIRSMSAARRPMRTSICVVFIAAMILHVGARPERAEGQSVQVVSLHASAAGGYSGAGAHSLLATVGAPGPSGVTRSAEFGVTSGPALLFAPSLPVFRLVHTPVELAPEGVDFSVRSQLDGGELFQDGELHFRRGGDAAYASAVLSMDASGALRGLIPASAVTSRGIAYRLTVTDRHGRVRRSPPVGEFGVGVRIESPGLQSTDPLPGGTSQSAYRLVSVPLRSDEPDPESILFDDLGPYDAEAWRLFELAFDQTVREFPGTSPLLPGRGFWIISATPGRTFDTGPGVTADPARAFSVALHPGWNIIGNPFHFQIPVSNVWLASNRRTEMRFYDGAWNDPINERIEFLTPFTGYAVYSPSRIVDTLWVDPMPHADIGVGHGKASRAASAAPSRPEWAIRIVARSGSAWDGDNVAGVALDAADGPDELDFAEPPSVDAEVSLSFKHPEWGMPAEAYSTDIRPLAGGLHVWNFDLNGRTAAPVRLEFERQGDIPPDFDLQVIDERTGTTVDLWQSSTYVVSGLTGTARPFRLIVGPRGEVSEHLDGVVLSGAAELFPIFPNPVRTTATVTYGLGKSSSITLRLYDSVGRLVHELVNGARPEGIHSHVLDTSTGDRPLVSGLYVLELRTGDHRRVRTFVVVR